MPVHVRRIALLLGVVASACGLGVIRGADWGQEGLSTPLTHAASGRTAATPQPPTRPSAPLPPLMEALGLRKTAKLSSHLDKLYRIDVLGRTANRPVTAATVPTLPNDLRAMANAGMMRLDERGRVQVFVQTVGDPEAALSGLIRLGLQVERMDRERRLVQGRLPVASLEAASLLETVQFVRLPDYPVRNAGSVTTEGDAILRADELRATYGADGSGVRVGVISDGLEGLAEAQASGDLPPVNWTTCNVVPQSPTAPGAGAEGTAMLEIVHDLAPAAELWFGHFGWGFGGTVLDFMAAVDCLADHVDVIVDDIGFYNAGPYDGTSPVSLNAAQELNDLSNRVRGYYTAVGNNAASHYQEPFVNSGYVVGDPALDFWTLHRFQATANTTDAGLGILCAPGVFCGNTVRVSPGGVFAVFVQWNDPFGASSNDYDLLLYDSLEESLYLASYNVQAGAGSDPVEWFAFQNAHGVTTDFAVLIGNYGDLASSRTFDMFVWCSGCHVLPNNAFLNFNTVSSSVANNSDAGGGVVSLGTINASDPGHDTIAIYSSRGPTNDGRVKPDAVAIDGVSITGAGGFSVPFFGTSAAAPHAGGIAALLLSCNPSLRAGEAGDDPGSDRTALRNALLAGALDLGSPGMDTTYGAGRLDAYASRVHLGPCVALRVALCSQTVDCDNDRVFPLVYGDGCSATDEIAKVFNGVPLDSENPWDFYTVPVPALKSASSPTLTFRDSQILAADAQAVFAYARDAAANGSGKPLYEADLNQNGVKDGWEYDRSSVGSAPPGPPDGFIAASDAQKAFAMARDTNVYRCSSGYRMDDPLAP